MHYSRPALKNCTDIYTSYFCLSPLLKLESRVNLTKNVQPITFASHDNGSLPVSCTVAGWGYTIKNKKTFSTVLMEANVTLTDDEQSNDCQKNSTYCSKAETGPTHVCTFL